MRFGLSVCCCTTEHPHLRRRSDFGILVAHRAKCNSVPMPLGHIACPGLELFPSPFEAMVLMPELAGGERFKAHVVLRIRRGDDDRVRLRVLEDNSLESRQARRIEVLDDLNGSCSLKSGEALILIHERTLEKTYPLLLFRRHRVKVQTLTGDF